MCNHVDKIITTVDSFCPHELKLISLFYFSHGVFRPFVCLSLILQLLRLQLLTLNTQPSTLNPQQFFRPRMGTDEHRSLHALRWCWPPGEDFLTEEQKNRFLLCFLCLEIFIAVPSRVEQATSCLNSVKILLTIKSTDGTDFTVFYLTECFLTSPTDGNG